MGYFARATRVVAQVGCASLLIGGCEFETPLDVLGVDETVIETRNREEVIPDPPAFDPELSIAEEFEGCRMRVNKSASITHLNVKKLEGDARAKFEGVIFPTRVDALAALGARTVIPSMEVVNGLLKPWNDGMYAAIERLAENGGAGSRVDKRATFDALLATMLERAATGDDHASTAAAHFRAAQLMAPGPSAAADVTPSIEAQARSARDRFKADVFSATTIGFYTWAEDLSAIFQRDRFLQTALPPGAAGLLPAAAVARALAEDDQLAERYESVLRLYRGLTNPFRDFDPLALRESLGGDVEAFVGAHPELTAEPPCDARFSWLPASQSPETKFIAAQYCAGMPPGNLLDALIAAIQSGSIDLTPTAAAGFYDWQLYALETLLLPERSSESRHLALSESYREKLIETFKSLLIQTRETHVKQLGTVAVPGSAVSKPREVDVYPLLPVEPFPTFYLRTARAYAFLHNLLDATLGADALQATSRLIEDGTTAALPLSEELTRMTQLSYGLHLVAAASIGMPDELTADERAEWNVAAAEQAARSWLASWREDPEIARDPRVAVPIVQERGRTRNLAVVGVRVIQIAARFPKGREPKVMQEPDGSFESCVVRSFIPFEPYMLVEQSLEFSRSSQRPPLTREALRAALDRESTLPDMLHALESVP